MPKIKIGFFGTPELSSQVLSALIKNENFEVAFAVTNPDKPIGRKQILSPSPVKSLSQHAGIPVFTPIKIRNNTEFLTEIANFDCDYFVVVAYGKILPAELLQIPKKMCINVHGSILPKYRGASPIQSALLHGEKMTGVTIMQMSEDMDEGAMILVEKIEISENETSATLFQKFWEISPKALIDGILWLEKWELFPIEQNHNEATYCTKINKEDGQISWNDEAKNIFHRWQAFTPWPGIFTFFHEKRLLLEEISVSSENINTIWKVFKNSQNQISISTKNGSIVVKTVKPEGKKSQNIIDFLNGNPDFLDYIF